MIDIAWEFISVETIKELVNVLAFAKINVLHVHLSDDDSMNIELPSFPGIVEFTALKPK